MARSNSSVTRKKRHKKVLKQAKGYFGQKSTNYRRANEQVRKSLEYAFRDRKQTKREFRSLWIKRINSAARMYNFNYSKLMRGLSLAKIELNRKMIADLAVENLEAFEELVNIAKKEIKKDEDNLKKKNIKASKNIKENKNEQK